MLKSYPQVIQSVAFWLRCGTLLRRCGLLNAAVAAALTVNLLWYSAAVLLLMVPGAGIEPARCFQREILSLLCLPISPSGLLLRCTAAINSGQSYWIRTSGLQLRRLLLYPSELRAAAVLVVWWDLCESNTAPTDYESAALTNMS